MVCEKVKTEVLTAMSQQKPVSTAGLNEPSGFNSTDYWRKRYRKGGTSGAGSYGRLAVYKAQIVNELVAEKELRSIIEHGCGDGNQAALFDVETYTGLDVSPHVIRGCRERFLDRLGWSFHPVAFLDHLAPHDAAISLDVIYHLVEHKTFETYMTQLFATARRYVLIYSTDEQMAANGPHVRHRAYSQWIADNRPRWTRIRSYDHPYPRRDNSDAGKTAQASFEIFEYRNLEGWT